MGSYTSVGQAEQEFEDALNEIKNDKEESYQNVFAKANCLCDFSHCLNYYTINKISQRYPNNLKRLILKSIDSLTQQTEPKIIQTHISLLSRIIPNLALTITNIDDCNWLFVGENSSISTLYTDLKSLLFAPYVFNQEEAESDLLWYWGSQLTHKLECSRTDALFLLFFGLNGNFYFPKFPDIQKQNIKLACLDVKISKYLIDSISVAMQLHEIHFLTVALPYLSLALTEDENIKTAVKDSSILAKIVDLTYIAVDDINSLIHYPFSISKIEIDLILVIFICLFIGGINTYDVVKLAISTIRVLQLANETKEINANHRIALTILTIITSTKHQCKLLSTKMPINNLGTKYTVNKTSVTSCILETISNTLEIANLKDCLPLIISVLHNIVPFIPDFELAPTLLNNIAIKFISNKNLFDSIVIDLERYVHGEIQGQNEEKKKAMKAIINKRNEFANHQELQQEMENAINSTTLNHDYPLIIDKVDTHLVWAKSVVIQLFEKRNLASLNRISKK